AGLGRSWRVWCMVEQPVSDFARKLLGGVVRISFAVVNHPDRKEWGRDLAAELLKVGPTTIAFDQRLEGAEANHIRALAAAAPGAEWHMVIEDDAVLSSRFGELLPEALEAYPDHIVSAYTGQLFPRHRQDDFIRAASMGVDLVADYVAHGVANAYPADIIEPLTDWIDPGGVPVDEPISHFAQHHGIPVVYLTPSLVDHRDEGPVLAATARQPRKPGRAAHRFILEEGAWHKAGPAQRGVSACLMIGARGEPTSSSVTVSDAGRSCRMGADAPATRLMSTTFSRTTTTRTRIFKPSVEGITTRKPAAT